MTEKSCNSGGKANMQSDQVQLHLQTNTTGAVTAVHPQDKSLLCRLPQELKNNIYAEVFGSLCLSFGNKCFCKRGSLPCSGTKPKPEDLDPPIPPHPLALLRVCRRIRDEIGNSWLNNVQFHFENPDALLDKLTALPPADISQIRHLRVVDSGLYIPVGGRLQAWINFSPVQFLTLLQPHLNLDVLTIVCHDKPVPEVNYQALGAMIRQGNGWKELHFLAHNSDFLAYGMSAGQHPWATMLQLGFVRKPQPAEWQRMLLRRDGFKTELDVDGNVISKKPVSTVEIFRATTDVPNGVLCPEFRKPYVQSVSTLTKRQNPNKYGSYQDSFLRQPLERTKDVLVVVKRGTPIVAKTDETTTGSGKNNNDTSSTQDFNPPLVSGDIRSYFPGKTWQEIMDEPSVLSPESPVMAGGAAGVLVLLTG